MNGILGMTELVLETELSREQRECLTTARMSTLALLDLINDLLDFSKIEAGKLELEAIVLSVRDVVADVAKTLAFRADEKGLELVTHVGADVPQTVIGDPGRLRQVLLNLVGNALKFTETGQIVIRVSPLRAEASTVTLAFAVEDTGMGIPKDKQSLIFEAFSQADSSTTRKFGGTGLGLTISTRLVELMGGTIRVESEVGKGSTFSFTATLGTYAPASARAVGAAGRTLVVEKNRTAAQALVDALEARGYATTTAETVTDAEEAVERATATATPFTLAVVDVTVGGIELAERLRAKCGVVALLRATGRAEDAARCAASRLAYVRKPVREDELGRAMDEAMGRATVGEKTPASSPGPLPTRRLRILLAEDNPVNQRVAILTLERAGHSVAVAKDGREAVDAFQAERFDVVLMDVQMPEMGGFEAVSLIRKLEASRGGRATPVIALTAHAQESDRQKCLAAGMNTFLTKPLQPKTLVALVAELADAATWDRQRVLEQLGGDEALLRDVIGVHLADAPTLMAEIRAAAAAGDPVAIERAAHRIKGSAGTFYASAVVAAAVELEGMGRRSDVTGAPDALVRLERAVEELHHALASVVGRHAAPA